MVGEIPEAIHVPAVVHGRVLLRRPPDGSEAEALLVGFHGYGQGAEASLEALEKLGEGRPWALAAIQALHPFYRRSDRSVVASWMTKLDREMAIADNVAYVGRALASIREAIPGTERLGIVGFSQGVAMAYRAAVGCGLRCHALVSLAGDVPPEVAGDPLAVFPDAVLVGRGREDDWYDEQVYRRDLEILEGRGVEATGHEFDGGHDWDPPFVEEARRFLAEHLG